MPDSTAHCGQCTDVDTSAKLWDYKVAGGALDKKKRNEGLKDGSWRKNMNSINIVTTAGKENTTAVSDD